MSTNITIGSGQKAPVGRPLLTYAIPIYNTNPSFLRTALDSVIAVARKHGDAEVILHDDASPSPEIWPILQEYRSQNPNLVTLSRSYRNLGIMVSRQILLEQTRGKYQIPFDHDDILADFDIESAVRLLEENPEFTCDYFNHAHFTSDDKGKISMSYELEGYSEFSAILRIIPRQNGAVIRTSSMRACGGYANAPYDMADDSVLLCRLATLGIAHRGVPRTIHRRHQGNATNARTFQLYNCRQFLDEMLSAYPRTAGSVMNLDLSGKPEHLTLGIAGILFIYELEKRNYGFCRKLLEKALSMRPDDIAIHMEIMHLHDAMEDQAGLLDCFDRAVEMFRDHPLNLINLVTSKYHRTAAKLGHPIDKKLVDELLFKFPDVAKFDADMRNLMQQRGWR